MSAAVAEEEAAVTTTEVEPEAVAKEAWEAESTVNTKLYFGNLPYNVDSAQLAGIIQPYASPELIEVDPFNSFDSLMFLLSFFNSIC